MHTESILSNIIKLLELPQFKKEGARFNPSIEVKLDFHTTYIYQAVYDKGIYLRDGTGEYWELESKDQNADAVGKALLHRLKYLSNDRKVVSRV